MGNDFSLKPGMLLGTATAATQIEGGDKNNSWYAWYLEGHISDGSDPSIGDDHYNRVREDTLLMAGLKHQVYRFGIEWSRIQPEKDIFCEEAIVHYKDELKLLRENGILPLVTLHHFTNPLWFEKMGAFENPECVELFLTFIERVVTEFGALADEYITINEPNVYVTNGYMFGIWPPGVKSLSRCKKVFSNLTACHIKAYEAIHRIRTRLGLDGTKVSFANHLRVFDPKNKKNPVHRFWSHLMEKYFQTSLTKAMMTGVFASPVKKRKDIAPGRYYDFIGINYYTRSTVSKFGDGVRDDGPKNDLDWEIYPGGLVRVCKTMHDAYQAPLYITENGTCDNTDGFRPRYIYDHLKVLCECDLPIERYYHWSFCDNFEWVEGYSARFGLVHVDYASQERTVKQSGVFFTKIIENGGVTQEMFDTYVASAAYKQKSGVDG